MSRTQSEEVEQFELHDFVDNENDPWASSEPVQQSLPRADGGKQAWLFLGSCVVLEALIWGTHIGNTTYLNNNNLIDEQASHILMVSFDSTTAHTTLSLSLRPESQLSAQRRQV